MLKLRPNLSPKGRSRKAGKSGPPALSINQNLRFQDSETWRREIGSDFTLAGAAVTSWAMSGAYGPWELYGSVTKTPLSVGEA